MFGWMLENIGTMLIGFAVLVVAALAVRSVYRTKKKGGCLGGCEGCSHNACCNTKK